MLLSQYFYNKGYVTSWNWFLSGLTIDITFYLSLTTCHLNFIVNFLWKCLISSTTLKIFNILKKQKNFQHFGPSFKIIIIIIINLLSRTLDYFGVDSGIKLFFPTLFFFISKKKKTHHHYNQQICIYICDSSPFSLLCFLNFSLCLIN